MGVPRNLRDSDSTGWDFRFPAAGPVDEQLSALPALFSLTITNLPAEEWFYCVVTRHQIVGRSLEADIRIPKRFIYVSRRHAEIWQEKSQTYLCDIGSKTGTRVNGVWLRPHSPVKIVHGDHIWLGGVELDLVVETSPMAELILECGVHPSQKSPQAANPRTKSGNHFVRGLLNSLSPAELEIAIWLCRGYFDDVDLGKILHRSPHTVRTQVGSIMRKLNLHSRHDIIGLLKR